MTLGRPRLRDRDDSESNVSRPATPSPAGAKSSTTVTVACKIPHGLILQLCSPTKWLEETRSGVIERIRYDKVGERIFVRGNSYPVNPQPGFPERGPMAGGYALTDGINAEFWNEWLRQNKQSPMVLNGLIFAMPTADATRGMAMERAELRSGLEPLKLEGDPRMPRPSNTAIGPITKADMVP